MKLCSGKFGEPTCHPHYLPTLTSSLALIFPTNSILGDDFIASVVKLLYTAIAIMYSQLKCVGACDNSVSIKNRSKTCVFLCDVC